MKTQRIVSFVLLAREPPGLLKQFLVGALFVAAPPKILTEKMYATNLGASSVRPTRVRVPASYWGILALSLLNLSASMEMLADDFVWNIYLKNNSQFTGFIWVNHIYQGYIPAGEARKAVRSGYTKPGELPSLGDLKFHPEKGGWPGPMGALTGKVPVDVEILLGNGGYTLRSTTIAVTADKEDNAYVWFGSKDPGQEPDPTLWKDVPDIDYFSKAETPPRDQTTDLPVYAATKAEVSPWRTNLISRVNTKFRAGDYQGALKELEEAGNDTSIGPQDAKVVKSMISQVKEFLSKKQ